MMNHHTHEEIREALEAGAMALNSLRKAQNHLDGARNWGLLDMFGGGMLTTFIKHTKLDEAKNCIRQAERDLKAFSRELRDVDLSAIDLSGFMGFADYFFDGFLADFMVQSRINEARERLAEAIQRVEALLRELRSAESRC